MIVAASFAKEGTPARTGIVLQLLPSDSNFGAEVERALVASSSNGTTSLITWGAIPANGQLYIDALPLDGVLRFYRARAVADGWDPSAWTDWTTGHAPTVATAFYQKTVVSNFLTVGTKYPGATANRMVAPVGTDKWCE